MAYKGELVKARFKIINDLSRKEETIDPLLAVVELVNCKNKEGEGLEFSGYTIECRLDDEHIQVMVATCADVMAKALAHPLFELIEMFKPEPAVEELSVVE